MEFFLTSVIQTLRRLPGKFPGGPSEFEQITLRESMNVAKEIDSVRQKEEQEGATIRKKIIAEMVARKRKKP